MLRRSLPRRVTLTQLEQQLAAFQSDTRRRDGDDWDPYLDVSFDVLPATSRASRPCDFTGGDRLPDALWGGRAGRSRHYVPFCQGYSFPKRYQLPTSFGTEPMTLLHDAGLAGDSDVPVVYAQLSSSFPPALWLPCRPQAESIARVCEEFATMAQVHRDRHHGSMEEAMAKARVHLQQQNMPCSDSDVLRYVSWLALDTFDADATREYHNSQELFLGEYHDPESLLLHFDVCPHLFSIPGFRTNIDLGATQPAVNGPGVATALFRTVYSKSLLFVQVHLASEVKLPARDPQSSALLWRDSGSVPDWKIGAFVRCVWPDNTRMCGGGGVVAELNRSLGTEFAHDMPVDAVAAVLHTMGCAGRLDSLRGVRGLREDIARLVENVGKPQLPGYYPSTADIPSPEYNSAEQVGMHLQYLAHLNDPTMPEVIRSFGETDHAAIRMGCAKAALEIGDRGLFHQIVASEPEGRMQHYMTQIIRRRKKRDLTNAEPLLADEQFEFAAPLWTKSTRIDPATGAGQREMQRLSATGKASRRKAVG